MAVEIRKGTRVFLKPSWIKQNMPSTAYEKYAAGLADFDFQNRFQKNMGFVYEIGKTRVEVKMHSDAKIYSVPFDAIYVPILNDNPPQEDLPDPLHQDCRCDPGLYSNWRASACKVTYPVKYHVERIIYNDPATIVFWKDGTKTVVKRSEGEKFNKYYAFCAALAKKVLGNNTQVNKIVASGTDQTPKKKETAKKKPGKKKGKFVRDEKGRYISATLVKKK